MLAVIVICSILFLSVLVVLFIHAGVTALSDSKFAHFNSFLLTGHISVTFLSFRLLGVLFPYVVSNSIMLFILAFIDISNHRLVPKPVVPSLRALSMGRLNSPMKSNGGGSIVEYSPFSDLRYNTVQSFENVTPTITDTADIDLEMNSSGLGNRKLDNSTHSWDDNVDIQEVLSPKNKFHIENREVSISELENRLPCGTAAASEGAEMEESLQFDGFRLRVSSLPPPLPPFVDPVMWSDLQQLQHRIDSSSCHIYTAVWKDTPVIVKLIKAHRISSPATLSEFEMEAAVLSNVRHPYVVQLLGRGYQPRLFLVLELLGGGSLSHALGLRPGALGKGRKRTLCYRECLQMGKAIAGAMNFLHRQWRPGVMVLHRDLKPDNIGWTSDGVLKIFDFGLCACVKGVPVDSDPLRVDVEKQITPAATNGATDEAMTSSLIVSSTQSSSSTSLKASETKSDLQKHHSSNVHSTSTSSGTSGSGGSGSGSEVSVSAGMRIGKQSAKKSNVDTSSKSSKKTSKDMQDYRLTGNTGTLRYMAPEVALGKPYNQSVDVYSFAVVFWQILTGELPFQSYSRKVYMERVVLGHQRPSCPRHWPGRLRILLNQCWHPQASKRPSFEHVLFEIDWLIREEHEQEQQGWRRWKTNVYQGWQNVLFSSLPIRISLLVVTLIVFIIGSLLFFADGWIPWSIQWICFVIFMISFWLFYRLLLTIVRGSSMLLNKNQHQVLGLELGNIGSQKGSNRLYGL